MKWLGWTFVVLMTALAIAFVASRVAPRHESKDFDFEAFGKLPVKHDGRVKPIDTVARASLMALSGKQTLVHDGQRITAVHWLLDVLTNAERDASYQVFRIDHPDLTALLAPGEERNRFSYRELQAQADPLMAQMKRAFDVEKERRNLYQNKVVELSAKLRRHQDLASMSAILPLAPVKSEQDWQAMPAAAHSGEQHPALPHFLKVIAAYQDNKPAEFNAAVVEYRAFLAQVQPAALAKSRYEAFLHHVEPFYTAMVLYVLVFLLAALSWIGWGVPLRRAAVAVMLVALLVHTWGIGSRMYLHGFAPVTNLYASAIFIGWICIILGLVLEAIFRRGIGSAMAAIVGFVTLIIAHNLSDGDNLESVRAVLATNLWLSTHVTTITIGYGATFLAGAVGILYIILGVVTPVLAEKQSRKEFGRIMYGLVCFATLTSFVGTVLGGIWADQSWGRFWGWDPKENGALLIVLMNALILHARWGGLIQERGIAVLAVAGNIITAWSWFGVNLLSVGLHSYGFMDNGWVWLGGFAATQLLVMAAGMLPTELWWSYRAPVRERAATPGTQRVADLPVSV